MVLLLRGVIVAVETGAILARIRPEAEGGFHCLGRIRFLLPVSRHTRIAKLLLSRRFAVCTVCLRRQPRFSVVLIIRKISR